MFNCDLVAKRPVSISLTYRSVCEASFCLVCRYDEMFTSYMFIDSNPIVHEFRKNTFVVLQDTQIAIHRSDEAEPELEVRKFLKKSKSDFRG